MLRIFPINTTVLYIRSDQISHSVVSDSLQPHESKHTRPPCPSPTPGVHADSRPLHWWHHPTISPSVVPFSFCPQSFQHQGLFQSVICAHQMTKILELQLNIQGWSPLRLTGLRSLLSKGLSGAFSSTTVQRHQCFGVLLSLWSSSHNCSDH